MLFFPIVSEGHSQQMKDILSPGEELIATSYWPTTDNRRLNHYQKQAIDLAWKCNFSMIQGPPGVLSFYIVCMLVSPVHTYMSVHTFTNRHWEECDWCTHCIFPSHETLQREI